MWPSRAELLVARSLGHEPHETGSGCSCGWKPKNPRLLPRAELSNHIWMSIHEAKAKDAAGMGGRLCEPCKGEGVSMVTNQACEPCNGSGVLYKNETLLRFASIARQYGHFERGGMCTCGEDGDWLQHAVSVAKSKLKELEDLQEEIKLAQGKT